jgi:hypothetical protein
MLIQVQETHPAEPGKSVATVIAAGGARFDIWPEKLAAIHVGAKYEIEVKDREFRGRIYRKIVKFALVNGDDNGIGGTGARPANGNGAAKANGHAGAPAAPPSPDGEGEFVGRALAALILKGEVGYHEGHLTNATAMLRRAWRASAPSWQMNGGDHGGNA